MASTTAPALPLSRPAQAARKARFFAAGAKPQRTWTVCQAQRQHIATQQQAVDSGDVSRRSALLGALVLVAAPLLSSSAAGANVIVQKRCFDLVIYQAENEAVTRGLSKYIKRKKYDNIESYLPPLLAARGQLVRSGYLLAQDPSSARVMLREGAFTGLRDNVRAVGEYAGQQGRAEEGSALVNGFFKALEAYDFALLQGSRSKEGMDVEGGEAKLKEAVAALDKLLELVPEGMVTRARGIVNELEAEAQAQREELAAEAAQRLQQRLEGLL